MSSREELKRRALEERRMREYDRRNLAGVSLMDVSLLSLELCDRPPSLTDAKDTSPPADHDAASEKEATLDDVTSPDIGVGGEHIDTDERETPMTLKWSILLSTLW